MTENTEKDLLRCGANLWRSPQLSPQGFRNVEKPILGPRFDSCRLHHFLGFRRQNSGPFTLQRIPLISMTGGFFCAFFQTHTNPLRPT